MSPRKAGLNKRQQKKTEQSIFCDFKEHCQFCVLSFQTRSELKTHVWTHFRKKVCQKTQKTLLLIVDDWFELHINHRCGAEHCDNEYASESVEFTQSLVKKEEYLEDIDDDDDARNDAASIVYAKIECESDTEMNFGESSSDSTSESECYNVVSRASRAKRANTKRDDIEKTAAKTNTILNGKSSTTVNPPRKRPVKCRICKLKFTSQTIIDHLQSRHVPKIYPIPTCETCGKTFSTPGNLRSHQHLHAERGRYICSYCGKEFFRNANLKEHINLHTGARPYVCEICNKTFHRETLLRNHRRVHSGEKKYRCNIENCERAYMFDIDLKRHKFSAHGIYSKKHPCFICGKVFSENKLLKKHLESHN